MDKYFVTSDIHDNYSLLIKSLNEQGFNINDDNHKLIICGDAFVFGNESGKVLEFLLTLQNSNRLIYIFGNHDLDLLNNIKKSKLSIRNKKCLKNIVKYYKNVDIDDDNLLIRESNELGLTYLLNNMIPYYEYDKYIFVHGFIPTIKNKYISNWRNLDINDFKSSTNKDGMILSMLYGIKEENKIIVFGHYGAIRARMMENATVLDWNNKIYKNVSKLPNEFNKTYYGNSFIALDSRNRESGFLNVIVL